MELDNQVVNDMYPKVVCVICARNEERYLKNTLDSIISQTVPVSIVLVNDGSTDRTYEIARKMKCCSIIINSALHDESYVGTPELGKIKNLGFESARKLEPDYVLVLDSDHILTETYVERIVQRMEEDVNIAVASGKIVGEKSSEDYPRGSGRLIRVSFWERYGMIYPVSWGWEEWIIQKALQDGKKCIAFDDITSTVQRPTKTNKQKCYNLGVKMRVLGYYWLYAIGRCALFFLKSPISGLYMFRGWAGSGDVEVLDVANFVRDRQKNKIKRKLGLSWM